MNPHLLPCIILFACGLGASCQSQSELAKSFEINIGLAFFAKEPQDVLRQLAQDLRVLSARHPDQADFRYLYIRTLELLSTCALGHSELDWRHEAAEAANRFPLSEKIATVASRAEGGEASAQKAYRLDSSYAPARVAYAKALIKSGKAQEARHLMEDAQGLDHVPEGFLTLARACFAARDLPAARRAAERQLNGRKEPSAEPSAGALDDVAQAHHLLARIHRQLGHPRQAARHHELAGQVPEDLWWSSPVALPGSSSAAQPLQSDE